MEANDSYEILIKTLNYPPSDRLRAILEELLTPQQALIAASLPGTAEEVAEKTGLDAAMIGEVLEDLFIAGAVFPKGDYANREYFRFARSIGQFHDATQASKGIDVVKDRKFFELWHDFVMNEWYPDVGKNRVQSEYTGSRIIPAWNSIKDIPDTLDCEDVRNVYKAQNRIAIVPCSCRYRTTAVDEHCAHTAEEDLWQCFQFDRSADYSVARQGGRELTIDEALELNDQVEQNGLLHIWSNNTSFTGPKSFCNCCRDCCMTSVPLDIVGASLEKAWTKSRFIAVVDQEACIGCQICVDRCQFDAIDMVKPEGNGKSKKLKAEIDNDACYGCGVCVLGCEKANALAMKIVRPPDHIPVWKG